MAARNCEGRGRRSPHRPLRRATALPAAILLLAAVSACALVACGGGGAAASPSAAPPGPGSSPLAGSVEQAAATYWALVDADAYERLTAVCVPGSPAAVSSETDDIARVRLLRVARVVREQDAAQVQVDVRVTPAGGATPWGGAGRHTLFMQLQRRGSGWLVASWGTSP